MVSLNGHTVPSEIRAGLDLYHAPTFKILPLSLSTTCMRYNVSTNRSEEARLHDSEELLNKPVVPTIE